jgi:uncharacterized membrane protein
VAGVTTSSGGARRGAVLAGAVASGEADRTGSRDLASGWRPVTVIVLSVIGFGIAFYLTLAHFDAASVPLACPAHSSIINCAKVTTSAWSSVFGIPVALLGLCYFTVVLGVGIARAVRPDAPRLELGQVVLAVGGMAFVLYLVYAELFLVHAICLWCTGVHITTFLLFVVILTGWGRSRATT